MKSLCCWYICFLFLKRIFALLPSGDRNKHFSIMYQIQWLVSSVPSDSWRPWTLAHCAPLSVEFSRKEYWSELPLPPPGIFLTQELNPGLLHCSQVLYCLSHQGSPNRRKLHHFTKLLPGWISIPEPREGAWCGKHWFYTSWTFVSICLYLSYLA